MKSTVLTLNHTIRSTTDLWYVLQERARAAALSHRRLCVTILMYLFSGGWVTFDDQITRPYAFQNPTGIPHSE